MTVHYDELLAALKRRLPAERFDRLGRRTGFIVRLRRITASKFVWAVVLSRFGNGIPGFEQARQWFARLTDKLLQPRAFQVRFKKLAAVRLMEAAFEEAVRPWRMRRRRICHPLGRLFADVVAWDSTAVPLADALRSHFKGLRTAPSQMKVQLAISVFGLVPLAARLDSHHRQDNTMAPPLEWFRPGTLLLFDRGFCVYQQLRRIGQAGMFYLCPMRVDGHAMVVGVHGAPAKVRKALSRHPQGVPLRSLLRKDATIRKTWDLEILLSPTGKGHDPTPFPARLVIVPGPKGKPRRYLTNLRSHWSAAALRELYRLRWQVELTFKELKQDLNLGAVPTKDPCAAQVLVWGSLLALAVSRTAASCLTPLSRLVGLAADLRVAVVTRTLRANVRLLAHALRATPQRARYFVTLLSQELRLEARQTAPTRRDSFNRLIPLLPTGPQRWVAA